ncbi:MAG: respiratory chain complex I subunit 1 family protein [Butyrivibrio sp.]
MGKLLSAFIGIAAYIIFAPVIGCFLAGLDRKITARMQGRKGPSIWQPLYDIRKLFSKETIIVNKTQFVHVCCFLVFMIVTGALFFGGFDILLVFLSLTTAAMFYVFAASSTNSPVSMMGANRELLQMLSYEPMVLLVAVGLYMAQGTFEVREIIGMDLPAIVKLPGVFIGFVAILTIKFRKSPFDLSTSHHAHQELVMGISTDMSGKMYGLIELSHWYENVFLFGVVALFFTFNSVWSIPLTALGLFLVFFIEILIDNINARVKWDFMIKFAWSVTIFAAGTNLLVLQYFL